jgi:hypothetical protein
VDLAVELAERREAERLSGAAPRSSDDADA